MIDRIYLMALIVVLFQRDLFIVGTLLLLLITFLAAIPLFTFEALAQALAPRHARARQFLAWRPALPAARHGLRDLPGDLPEIDRSSGRPSTRADEPGKRHYPKWPVVPTAIKIWGGEYAAEPKTFNFDYLDQSHAAHEASLAAVMPPPASSERLGDLFQSRKRMDAEGKSMRSAEGKLVSDTLFDPKALPEGFPFCGAGIDAFVARLKQQATKAAREAEGARSMIDAKWNDTEEKRTRKRAEAEKAEDNARAAAELVRQAREVLGTLPALEPVPSETIERFHLWLAQMVDNARSQTRDVQNAVSGGILDLARTAVTDTDLQARLPASVCAMQATSLVPSPRQSQHLMLGPAQCKTNSRAGSGIRLLGLDSDNDLGMMCCDCGVLEYWIKPEDLAARRFDRATAQTAGG